MLKDFYICHSKWSSPGSYGQLVAIGEAEPKTLARWVASFMQHPRGAETAARGFSEEQTADLERRTVAEFLALAAERNLFSTDAPGTKVGGVCRDFAIIAVSAFRERGIPARLRVGFADYLVPDRWEDHWLCEWYDGHRWRRLDVEFAAVEFETFDTTNVPCERFLTAAQAWCQIRKYPDTARIFGVSALSLGGAWFVAGSLFREMAALSKLELKPWDYWGLSEELFNAPADWPHDTLQHLDEIASRLSSANEECEGIGDWPLPRTVVSFPHGEPLNVCLDRH